MKYRGIFIQTELYNRWINGIDADGVLPVSEIVDKGFYIQSAFYPIKQKLEVYGSTSWIFGDKDAGYSDSHEYLAGANVYWFVNRNVRSNVQIMSDVPVAGQQHVWVLRRRPEGPDHFGGHLDAVLRSRPSRSRAVLTIELEAQSVS